jgi:hypothetical protein
MAPARQLSRKPVKICLPGQHTPASATQKPRGVRNFGTLSAYARFATIAGERRLGRSRRQQINHWKNA